VSTVTHTKWTKRRGPVITQTIIGGNTSNYSYDGDGKRLTATVTGTTTNYLWDRNNALPQLALEQTTSAGLIRRYIDGLGPISLTTPTGSFYYQQDAYGSAADLTSSTGATEWAYTYDPYGAARTTTKVDPNAPTNPLQFDRQYTDGNDLYNLRAREYDDTTGRFLQTDPLAQALNDPYVAAYVYSDDQPTLLDDPSGQCGICDRVGGAIVHAPQAAYDVVTNTGYALGGNAADAYYRYGGGVDGTLAAINAVNPITVAYDAFVNGYREGGLLNGINQLNPAYWLLVEGDECGSGVVGKGDLTAADRHCVKAALAALSLSGVGASGVMVTRAIAARARLFENLAPNDAIQSVQRVSNDRLSEISGRFNYVVLSDRKLVVGSRRYGHIDLANGQPVRAAGEVHIVNGNIRTINNASGHYRPSGASARRSAVRAFKAAGLDVPKGAYVETR
jgi:RHS repeat-associated protein